MKDKDLDILCAALAFTAVAMKSDSLTKDSAQRAAGLAYLIKEFCRASVPEAFSDQEGPGTGARVPFAASAEGKFEAVNRMATAITQLMRENDECMPKDLLANGFTSEEIDRHWRMAKALAHVELNMMDS